MVEASGLHAEGEFARAGWQAYQRSLEGVEAVHQPLAEEVQQRRVFREFLSRFGSSLELSVS